MKAGERDLRGAGQVQVVFRERVDVRALGREEAGAVHRLLADQHRRQHRHMTVLDRLVERETVESEREQRGVADEVAEPGAGQPRRALHLEAPDLGVLGSLRRRLADAADLLGVLLRLAVGRGGVGRIRHLLEQPVAFGLGDGELLLDHAQLLLHAVSSSSSAGVGLPFSFRRPRSSSARGISDRQRSSAARSASNASAPSFRATAARKPSGSLRAARRSITRRSLSGALAAEQAEAQPVEAPSAALRRSKMAYRARYASITCATPSSVTGGQTKSAIASTRSVAFSTATP